MLYSIVCLLQTLQLFNAMDKENNKLNLSVGLRVKILGVSTAASYMRKDGVDYAFCKVTFRGENIADIAGIISSELRDILCLELSESIKNISVSVELGCNNKYNYLRTVSGAANLSVLRLNNGGSALLLELTDSESNDSISEIIKKAKDFFGIDRMFFYASKNAVIDINELIKKDEKDSDKNAVMPPANLFGTDGFCVYADYHFEGKCGFIGDFMYKLLGIESISFFAGKNNDKAYFALFSPIIKYGGITVSDLCFQLSTGTETSFSVSGGIEFKIIENMKFSIKCEVSPRRMMLSAAAEPKDGELVNLFDNFYIGKTALMIGNESGNLILGLICELSLNKLYLNAAVQLLIMGGAVTPQLISCSFGKLSLSLIINSIIGTDIPGLEVLDFIAIEYFDFQMSNKFNLTDLKENNIGRIVQTFNGSTTVFNLEESSTAVNKVRNEKGYALIDKKRMRHYYINENGSLYLRPQFYYCSVKDEMTLADGSTVSAGIFFCAQINIIGIRIRALFSARKNDGILAFASVSEIKLPPFLVIKGSKAAKRHTVDVSKNSVLSQFIDNQENGVVFFLQASKNDVSFYFDGSISLLNGLIEAEAQLYFCRNAFALNVETVLLGITTRLSLCANAESFEKAEFRLYLLFDTSKLEEKLKKFSATLKETAERYRKKYQNDIKALNNAKQEVKKLSYEIDILNRKKSDCRARLHKMSRFKQLIMAPIIACEIAAYEVAIGVLYASLAIADAALEIAKRAVECAEKLTDGALKALDNVINSVTSLFFVRRLSAEIDVKTYESLIEFQIEFVALGKEYKKTWKMHKSLFNDSKLGLDNISDVMCDEASNDFKRLENGYIDSNFEVFKSLNQAELFEEHKEQYDFRNSTDILACNSELITFMNSQYLKDFGENNQLFDELSCDYYDILGTVEANIDISHRVVNMSDLNIISEEVNRCAIENSKMFAAASVINEKNESIDSIYRDLQFIEADMQFLRKKRYDEDPFFKNTSQRMMSKSIMEQTDSDSKKRLYDYAEEVIKNIKDIYKDAPKGYTNPLADDEIRNIMQNVKDHFRVSDDIE